MTNLCLFRSPRSKKHFFAEWPNQEKHVYKPLLFCFLIKKKMNKTCEFPCTTEKYSASMTFSINLFHFLFQAKL